MHSLIETYAVVCSCGRLVGSLLVLFNAQLLIIQFHLLNHLQFLKSSDKFYQEVHQDITDADSDDQNVLNTNGDRGGSINSLLDKGLTELGLVEKGANIESSALHLNLNSWPPVSPIADPKNAKTKVPASKRYVKPEISRTGSKKLLKNVQYQSMDSDNDPALRKPSKRVRRTDSSKRSAGSEKGNSSVNVDKSVENPNNGTKDEFG